MRLRADRLLLGVGILALAVAGVFAAYSRFAAFFGELAVGAGREEDIVAAPAEVVLRFAAPGVVQGVSGRAIPFNDAESGRKIFPPGGDYHVARLPFLIKVSEIEILTTAPASDFLEIAGPESKKRLAIRLGAQVSIGGTWYATASVSKWSGLLRDPQGVPMASLTVETGAAGAHATAFIASGTWQVVEPGVALHFQWVENEAAAKTQLPGIESARWGVVDGTAMNWFQSFAPGTGAQLSTGENVTLVGFEEQRAMPDGPKPAIAVEMGRGGEKSVFWVGANETGAGGLIRFEHPALLPRVFTVCAWDDGRALVAAFENGQPAGAKQLRAGQAFRESAADVNVWLQQVLSMATPVTETESTLWAAVLKTREGEAVTLRQGEAVRLGDSLVEYVREAPAPTLRYRMRINGKDVTLDPGESLRVGNWRLGQARLRQAGGSKEPTAIAVLAAEYTPVRNAAYVLLAVGIGALLAGIAKHAVRKRPRN